MTEGHAESGGGSNILGNIGGKISGKAKELYGKGFQKFKSVAGTRKGGAESTGFLRGDVVESLSDMAVGAIVLNTYDRVNEVLGRARSGFENTAIQTKKAFATPITHPGALIGNVVKTPIVIANEATDLAATTIGSIAKFAHDGYEGVIARPADRLAIQAEQKLGYIPVIGKPLGTITAATINIANKLLWTPFRIMEWTREKVGKVMDKGFNWVRGKTAGSGAQAATPAQVATAPAAPANNVTNLAAERVRRQGRNGHASSSGDTHAAAAHG